MNPANSDSFKFTLSAREVKKRFSKVYENVISNYFTFDEDLISGAKAIINSKNQKKKFKTDLPSYQLAFLLSFGVQDTCTVARKFHESIKNQTEVIKKLSKNNPIRLLCLESESLPAAIGVCQVINEIVKEFQSAGKSEFREIQISVIDNRRKWRRLCAFIVDMVNSYFTNIELKLDFVEDFTSWSSKKFKNIIKEIDLMILARVFSEDGCFTDIYNLMKILLDEMKEDSVFFYLDSCNDKFYANLKHLISKTSFSEVKSCENLHVLFEDLEDEQYHLDLPVSWNTDFQSVMFSTWIKAANQRTSFLEATKPIAASNQLNPITSIEKSNDKETLNGPISHSEIAEATTSRQANIVNGEKKVKSPIKKSNKSDIPTKQPNLDNDKKKIKSSKIPCNLSDSPSGQVNVVSGKQKIKSSIKHCDSDTATPGSTKTGTSRVRNASHTKNTHEMLNTLLSILNKETTDSSSAKPSQKSQCPYVPSYTVISKNVISQAEHQRNFAKGLGYSTSSTTQNVQPKRKVKTTISKTSTSTDKMISTNKEDETLFSSNGNVSPSVLKTSISQKEKGSKPTEKSIKTKTSSESTATKEEINTKLINKKSATATEVQSGTSVAVSLPKKSSQKNATLTKKSIKNNATEKVKLTGKFARMDLEKKNKDERHKMRAKKASFAKHANFDYDD